MPECDLNEEEDIDDHDVEGKAPEAPTLHSELQAIRMPRGRISLLGRSTPAAYLMPVSALKTRVYKQVTDCFTPKGRKAQKT